MIESLSDSTIYTAYYTVAHLLQSDIFGSKPGPFKLKPEQLTTHVWDYIFMGDIDYDENKMGGIPLDALETMRREFEYWYPVDMSKISFIFFVNLILRSFWKRFIAKPFDLLSF